MSYLLKRRSFQRLFCNWAVDISSIFLCLLLLPTRLPGMEILGIGPNWLLIWLVSWSLKKKLWQGAIAGVILGLLQDSMTRAISTPIITHPSHALGLGLVGALTAALHKQRYIKEELISVAFIVFVMTGIAEAAMAIQFSLIQINLVAEIWKDYQRIALCSAVLSSLWTPVLYLPLSLGWQMTKN